MTSSLPAREPNDFDANGEHFQSPESAFFLSDEDVSPLASLENGFQFQYPMVLLNTTRDNLTEDRRESADYYLKLGNRHYNSFLSCSTHQDLDLAITCYRRALESNPSLAEGYVKLASALFDKGEMSLEMAIQYCQTALSMNPQHPAPHLFLGYFLRQAGHLDAALREFEKSIEKAPMHSARARMAYGRTLLEKASRREADTPADTLPFAPSPSASIKASGLQKAQWAIQGLYQLTMGIVMLPTDFTTVSLLKSALMSDLQIYSILGLARSVSVLGLGDASLNILRWATRRLPNEPVFFHYLGDLHAKRKETDTAIYYYSRAQELDPTNVQLQKKLGRAYLQGNDTGNAARSLEQVVEQDATDFESMYQLAQLYTERNDYMRALYYFKELTARYEKNPYVHSNMAYVLFKLEDYDGAIKEYRLAVSYGEDKVWTATVAQTLGTIYYQLKHNNAAAIEMFQLAYKLDPNNLECVTMLADLYVDQGQYEAAIGAYRYILNFEPDNADCYSYIGYLLWQLDKNDEAVAAYNKAIAFNPDCAIAYNNLGVIYLDEQSDAAKALEMFQTALELQPDYTLACFNIGRSQEATGDITAAAKTYSSALALNAGNPELSDEEILERLDSLFRVG